MKQHSIKSRLIASVLLVELLSAVAVCTMAFAYEHHARFRSFDVMLRGRADSLLGAVQDAEDPQDNVMLDGTEASLPRSDIFEVWDQNLRILGKSPNWDGVDPSIFTSPGRRSKKLSVHGHPYGAIKISGVRVVDPGDKGGGIPRTVLIFYGSPLEPVWKAVWEAVEFYALTTLGLLVLTALVMYWLLNRELTPLTELAQQASAVSATSWAFDPSPQVTRARELAPLATTLQTLLKSLERSFSQQQQFVGDAAHELKTGVSVVKSSLQLLIMKPRTAEQYHAGLERCQADCDRLEEIVSGMLTLARVENQPSSPTSSTLSRTSLTESLHDVVRQLDSISQLRDVAIQVAVPHDLDTAMPASEAQILFSNILTNALQHSAPGTTIHVSANRSGSQIHLEFLDHGDGIDALSLPYVFNRFYRTDPSRSRQTGGSGLGLSICQAIVRNARGTIEISSKPGQGTLVRVDLPAID